MSYITVSIDLSDVTREIQFDGEKLAEVLNSVADYCDGAPDDRFIEDLIAVLDNATKGMIGIIAKAIEAKNGGGT